jgi:hypothetical protein
MQTGTCKPWIRLASTLLAVMSFIGAAPAPSSAMQPDDAVIAWNINASAAARAACLAPVNNPIHESRMFAMVHVGVHDALNAIDRRSRPYAFDGEAAPGASPEAAVAAAAHDVLVSAIAQLPLELHSPACIDAGLASVEAAYAAALAALSDGPAKAQGIAVGQAAAAAIVALRANDGAVGPFLNFDCPQDVAPGEYQCTPGTPLIAFEVWAGVDPFVLTHGSQFRPGPPYRVGTKKYAADLNEVKALGGDGVTTPSDRTPDQTEIALFWVENSPFKWNRVARTISLDRGLNLWENARLFGLLNMALADGYVAMMDSKNRYNYWRPITAIRAADTDGNPGTTADPTWTPLVQTPPNQDYVSGHAIEGGAAAEVLRGFFGTDWIGFEDCSLTLPAGSTCDDAVPQQRVYTSLSEAAAENAYSRILVGFHFRKSIEAGVKYGTKIGRRAVNRYMRLAR